jgi:streptogramin lyase
MLKVAVSMAVRVATVSTLAGAALAAGATPAQAVTIKEFEPGLTNTSYPNHIAAGPDGDLWFAGHNEASIERMTPEGVLTEFFPAPNSSPEGIAAGPDGNVWFTEPGWDRIGRISPEGSLTEFSETATRSEPLGIAAGPDGNLWFTELAGSRIGRITPQGVMTEFSQGITAGGEPRAIAAGPDGNLWFTEPAGNRIGRITPQGVVTEFSQGITPGSEPRAIAAGPDGNLWFTERLGNRIGRITPRGVVTEFSEGITPRSEPFEITAGPDGNLWFTERSGDRIGRITTDGVVTEFGEGITGSEPTGITAGLEGDLWFTEGSGQIGRLTPGASTETWEGFSATNPMPAGRTPGNSSSPFNQRIENPVVLPNSPEMVAWLLSQHTSGAAMPADHARPAGGPRPMYYASSTDPIVELQATEPWGPNPLQGRRIRVPERATAEEASDGHLTIVLAPSDAQVPGETVDMWQAKPVKEGKLSFAWGGPGNITGTLLQSQGNTADAAGFDLEAGQVRGPELKAGIIPHALVAAIKDTKPTYVYPASHTDGQSSALAAPPMGQRFYLAYSDAEIEALPVAPWKKAILTALAHYGFYVGDSGDETISFIWEGSLMYTPLGASEPFSEIGKEQGLPTNSEGNYIFNLSEGVDWTRLRAIAPPIG